MVTKTGKRNSGKRTSKKQDSDPILADFLEEAGYSEDDVLAFNRATRRVFTKNGGDYAIRRGKILHFGGPSPDPTERV